MNGRTLFRAGLCWVVILATADFSGADEEAPNVAPMVTFMHDEVPEVELRELEYVWPPELVDLWRKSLEIPESDLRREAAEAISMASTLGMNPAANLEQPLRAIVSEPNEVLETRLAAAEALIACGFRDTAEVLAETAANSELVLAMAIEPALATWDYGPMREVWLARLNTDTVHPALLRIAVASLGELDEPRASQQLARMVSDTRKPLAPRLLAASSLSMIDDSPAVALSTEIIESNPAADLSQMLLGVRLLLHRDSPEVVQLLLRYADSSLNVVRAEAIGKLARIAPDTVVARAENGIADEDGNVRQATVLALVTAPAVRSVRLLGDGLRDPIPAVRRIARENLWELSQRDDLRDAVIDRSIEILADDSWRGIEQALLLLTQLDQKQIRDRVFELLDHPRSEVYVTAAWSLRKLSEQDWSDQLFAALQKVLAQIDSAPTFQRSYALSHLIESMGVHRHREAQQVLEQFIPKTAPYFHQTRSSAIWSLGYILEGKIDANVVEQLEARLDDGMSFPSEYDDVRAMSAVALGSMGSQASLPMLRKWYAALGRNSYIGSRSAWAISALTGQPLEPATTPRSVLGGWFVEPIEQTDEPAISPP
jgi:hypothetical protein